MELSLIIDLITAVAVILGILFGLLQLRHYHLSREREAAALLLNSFRTRDFLRGIWVIQGLPHGLAKDEIEDRLGDEIGSVYHVMTTWESIGIQVFHREISIDLVDDAHSGPIILSWQRLERYVTELRDDLNRETLFEWFQWLAERMIDREKAVPPIPAHLAYRDWQP
jgi:hypothetical protein